MNHQYKRKHFQDRMMNWLWLTPGLILFAVLIVAFYPGGFSTDSFYMYRQATGETGLTDIKPPFAVLYMRMWLSIFGDGGLVIGNSMLYILGSALAVKALFYKQPARTIALATLLLFPPLLFMCLSNWIDAIVLAGLSGCAGSILCYITRGQQLRYLCFAFMFTVFTIAARYNAFVTVFPLQILILALWIRRTDLTSFKRAKIIFGFFIAVLASNSINPLLNHTMDTRKIPKLGYIYIYDLITISLLQEVNLIPNELYRKDYQLASDKEKLAALRQHYHPHHNWYYGKVISNRADPEQKYAGYALRTALNYPGDLLFSRFRVNKAWLTQGDTAFVMTLDDKKAREHGIQVQKNKPLAQSVTTLSKKLATSGPFFQGFWYLLICFGALVSILLLIALKGWRVALQEKSLAFACFALAGLINWASMVPIMVSAEFRYLIPTVFFALLLVMIAFSSLFTRNANFSASPT